MADLFGRPGRTHERTLARGRTVHVYPIAPGILSTRDLRRMGHRERIRGERPQSGPVNGTKPSRDWRGPAVAGITILPNGTVVLGGKS